MIKYEVLINYFLLSAIHYIMIFLSFIFQIIPLTFNSLLTNNPFIIFIIAYFFPIMFFHSPIYGIQK